MNARPNDTKRLKPEFWVIGCIPDQKVLVGVALESDLLPCFQCRIGT
jgi:hypothetical protein